jgi:hypothetical protein
MLLVLLIALSVSAGIPAYAQVKHDDVSVTFLFAPRTGTFTLGSEFQLPVFIDTEGEEVEEVELEINFDPDLVSVVRPSGGKSLFDEWKEAPTYD